MNLDVMRYHDVALRQVVGGQHADGLTRRTCAALRVLARDSASKALDIGHDLFERRERVLDLGDNRGPS